MLEQDEQNRTDRTGLSAQKCQEKIYRTGQSEQGLRDRRTGTGQPEKGQPGLPGQGCQDRTARKRKDCTVLLVYPLLKTFASLPAERICALDRASSVIRLVEATARIRAFFFCARRFRFFDALFLLAPAFFCASRARKREKSVGAHLW